MFYILEVSNSIFNIFSSYDSGIVQLYKLSQLSTDCKLKKFEDGAIIGYYYVDSNKIFHVYSKNNCIEKSEISEIPFELIEEVQKNEVKKIPTKKILFNRNKQISSEINVKLPPINTEITITSDNKDNEEKKEEESVDLDELKRQIDELSKLKDAEIDELENLNENLHEFENKIIEEKFSVDAEKNKLKRDKEKWEEFKNIFNADKKIYKIMKEQLDNSEIDEIPELFEKKYPIFRVLDDNNLLDTSSEIYEYIKLLPEDDSVYIPKDIVLKGLFNDNNPISSISLTELKESNNFDTNIETDDESS